MKTAEIDGYIFECIGLTTYPVIESRNCQTMKNQLNAVDCAKLIEIEVPAIRDMIDPVDYLQDEELLNLVQS